MSQEMQKLSYAGIGEGLNDLYNCCSIPKNCLFRKSNDNCKLNLVCEPIVDACNGCKKVENGYCIAYTKPAVLWKLSKICPLASHIMYQSDKVDASKERVGQQKQQKVKHKK